MAQPASNEAPPHFPAPNAFNTPTVQQDPRTMPPPHWQQRSYANAVSGSFQTPNANVNYAAQGFRGPDGRGPDGPVTQEQQFHFSLRPIANANPQAIPIDPALLRDNREHDAFIHPKHKDEREHKERKKPDVRPKPSGKSKKAKGKRKADAVTSDSESDGDAPPAKTRSGRGGVPNYNKDDIKFVFYAVKKVLPQGERGWRLVEDTYNKKAVAAGRPERKMESIRTKYHSYLKKTKPTGDSERPAEVVRAYEIEELINNKASTRDIDDDSNDEIDDDDDHGHNSGDSSDDDSDVPKVVEPVRTAIARRAPTPPLRRTRVPADALGKIVSSLDLAVVRRRDEALFSGEVSALQRENNDLKRERDLAAMERALTARFGRGHSRGRSRSHSRDPRRGRGRGRTTFEQRDTLQRVRGKVRVEQCFPDGGAMTTWQTDASSDATDFDYRPKKKSRNRSPTPYSRRTSTPSPPRHRSISRHHSPTPGPSRYRSPSPRRTPTPGPSHLPTSDTVVSGSAVELVATPRRGGAPIRLIISPSAM
ncbi:hypothetical protein MSAN_00441400 [Mycena sanguinolenta]|uniref:DUF6818 domain-containing protein n=1 Tax=Mycena sanguinolenta TaxID=230812 RepID=A0A8H6ZDS4_9AGAR|nr:hypothetical protein MSAN_00441400 [Mycena sanguinolenta]